MPQQELLALILTLLLYGLRDFLLIYKLHFGVVHIVINDFPLACGPRHGALFDFVLVD